MGGDASVESPGYLEDRDSGSLREVDVVVRRRVGSADVVVMFECRDRSSVEDVRWIEQVAQKRNSVGAAVAVAVSTSGFTSGALSKAAGLGVEIREVVEVDVGEVESWFQLRGCELVVGRSRVVHAEPIVVVEDARAAEPFAALSGSPLGAVILADGERRLSLVDLWNERRPDSGLHDGLPLDGSVAEVGFELRDTSGVLVVADGEQAPLRSVRYTLELWIERRELPLHRVISYQKDASSMVEAVEYLIELDGDRGVATLTNDTETGEQYLAVRDFPHAISVQLVARR